MEQEQEGYWLQAGRVLNDKYKILSVIDEGGMGIVYLGYDLVLHHKVSIKEYFPRRYAMRAMGQQDITVYKGRSEELFKKGLDKFVEEARTLARFEALESVVVVKDFFYENKTAYMVMEHVEGENVKQRIEQKGCMRPEEVLAIMKPILHSIGKLHEKGLLHRDISPDNIILNPDGKGILIDFGAARFYGAADDKDKTMTVFFKRGYSAEEQYVENSSKGAYTDVYGACATMYFMLTGIHPEEAVHRLIRDRVVPLTRFHEIKMDPGQKRAIMKGMAVKAKNRYKSMERLCQDLYKEKAEMIRRHRRQVLGVVVLLVLAGSGVFIWRIKRTDQEPDMIKQTNVTQISGQAEDMMATGAAIEPDSTSVPTPTPVSYEMIQVVGMKKTEAVKKLQKLPFVQIKIKKVASKKNQQGKVIKQSISKGKKLKQDKTYVLVLSVGKGPEKATPTPVVTPTPTPKASQKSKKKKQQYDGALPW